MVTESPLRLAGALGAVHAVLYRPAEDPPRGGVLVVPPFAGEAHFAERSLVFLARRAAARGWAVLRFHFSGTGESEGEFADLTAASHRRDLAAAFAYLARLPGVDRVGVVAVRLGAVWACLATAAGEIAPAGLCLWDPVRDPAAYLHAALRTNVASQSATYGRVRRNREALATALLRGEPVHVLGGFPLGGSLYRELQGLRPPAPDVPTAVLARPPAGRLPGPCYWDLPRKYFEPPAAHIAATLDFLEALPGRPPVGRAAPAVLPFAREKPLVVTLPGGVRGHAVLHLPPAAARLGVYLVEVGVGTRAGMHRLNVRLARRLAAAGCAVLRLDPRGTGESSGEVGCQPLVRYYDRIEAGLYAPDLRAALAAASGAAGTSRWAVYGHCGAALSALLAFAGDPRVTRCVLVETPFFPALLPPAEEARKLRRPQSWLRLLTLRSDYGALVRTLWRRLRPVRPPGMAVPVDRHGCNVLAVRALRRALAAGQEVELLYAAGSAMYAHFLTQVRRLGHGARRPRVTALAEANHTFCLAPAQERLLRALEARLAPAPTSCPAPA